MFSRIPLIITIKLYTLINLVKNKTKYSELTENIIICRIFILLNISTGASGDETSF